MNFGWESEEEKIVRYMRNTPKNKLEWLQKMHKLLLSTTTPERKKVFWKLRGIK